MQRKERPSRASRLRRVPRPLQRHRVPALAGTRVVPQRLFIAFVSYFQGTGAMFLICGDIGYKTNCCLAHPCPPLWGGWPSAARSGGVSSVEWYKVPIFKAFSFEPRTPPQPRFTRQLPQRGSQGQSQPLEWGSLIYITSITWKLIHLMH